ncbi:antitoxin [Mycobacterium sp. DL440]|uniref:antitoxin n=1 Tax=Mycobacterium sp. DL440 TaxID=2675523 RepID=UPI00141D8C8B|nr:antitoxin [Mycobacterium sp. DL440]
MGFLDKAKSLLSQNADKVEQAIDKAGDVIDEKTQGKYSQHVDKAQEAAKNSLNKEEPQQ